MIIAWQFSTISKNQNNFLYIYSLSVLENLFKLFHSYLTYLYICVNLISLLIVLAICKIIKRSLLPQSRLSINIINKLKGKLASRTSKLYQLPLNFIIEALLYIQVLSNILVICDDPLLVA
ncbi:unnamed protein product [Rhizophagus irregularis]|nr:unnamed protein product [Rhizophagus irregularis]